MTRIIDFGNLQRQFDNLRLTQYPEPISRHEYNMVVPYEEIVQTIKTVVDVRANHTEQRLEPVYEESTTHHKVSALGTLWGFDVVYDPDVTQMEFRKKDS